MTQERAYRLLLRVYPSWFRDAYGEEMTSLFVSRAGRTQGTIEKVRLWRRMIADAVGNAVAVWRRGEPGAGGANDKHGRNGKGMHVETLLQDIRHGVRRLIRTPGFTLGAVALLAVAIGANATVFAMVDALLFRPPPWERPDEVVYVYQDSDDGDPSSNSYPATRDMAESDVFSAVAAMSPDVAAWDGPDGPVQVAIEYTTSSYLDVFGLVVQRGRWFDAEHDVPGAAPVAVVSAPAWRSRFGADPGVVGRTIRLNGQPVTIIGVGPDNLNGTYAPAITDFWVSISGTVIGGGFRVANLERRMDHWYEARARLAPGVTIERAQAAMNALAARLADAYPELNRGRDITVFASGDVRQHPGQDGDLYATSGLVMAVALMVLLLACANLANLLLVRGLGRSGEMAVRRALGAGRARVARLFLIESLVLAGVGAGVGVLLARWALAAVPALPIPLPGNGNIDLGLDARVGMFMLAIIALTTAVFGLAPALGSARTDVARVLRDERGSGSGGRAAARLRASLVAVQVTASLVLVLGAGLLARSLAALQGVDTGVDADRVAFVRASYVSANFADGEAAIAVNEILTRIEALPGVAAAASSTRLPAQRAGTTTTIVEGYAPAAGTDAVELDYLVVSDDYFETMGIPLVEGRLLGVEDVAGGATAILVNETAARQFWAGESALGKRTRAQGSETWRTVVGVVGDVPVATMAEATRPVMYFTARQSGAIPQYFVARTDGTPEALLDAMRREIGAVRSSITVTDQGTLVSHFGEALGTPRFVATLMSAFSLLAVILAGLGIYAMVSFSVARRTPELGIRMALGAERHRVVRMVVGEIVGVVALGLAAGIGLAALAAPRMEGALFGVRPLDPVTFAIAVIFLMAVAWAAAYLPARRAAGTDPARALRST